MENIDKEIGKEIRSRKRKRHNYNLIQRLPTDGGTLKISNVLRQQYNWQFIRTKEAVTIWLKNMSQKDSK